MPVKNTGGFTLIEIIIALMVISIGLGAVINTVSSSVAHGAHIKEKTLAHWVAQNRLIEFSLQQAWPSTGQQQGKSLMAGQDWYWRIKVVTTADKNIRRLDIVVYKDKAMEDPRASMYAFSNKPLVDLSDP